MNGYTTTQAAGFIGVSKSTLLSWLRQELLDEPQRSSFPGVDWRLWTDADIERAKKLKATMRRGPKPKNK